MQEKKNQSARSASTAYVYLFITFVLWGSLYVVSKYVLGKLPAFTISFCRFLLAFLFLTLVDRLAGKTSSGGKKKKLEPGHFRYVILIGFGGYFIAV